MFSGEILALAPGYADAMRNLSDGVRPRPRKINVASVVGIAQLVGGLGKPAYGWARDRIRDLAANDAVGEIVIYCDSPGGTVSGCHDLHQAIADAAKQKRVTAVASDLCASGAYYAICAASEVVVNTTGRLGSIGVYQVITDTSQLVSKNGIEVLIVRSGKFKGAGVFGAKVSAEQLEQVQSIVDTMAGHFVAAVARGRRLSVNRVKDLADGRIFVGQQAIAAGLADRIATIDDVLAEATGRLQRLIIEQLEGDEALAKFADLVASDVLQRARVPVTEVSDPTVVGAERRVSEIYPRLAATVADLRNDEADWRRQNIEKEYRRQLTLYRPSKP